MALSRRYSLNLPTNTPNTTVIFDQSPDFLTRTVAIDNLSDYWLQVSCDGQHFVPPFSLGYLIVSNIGSARVSIVPIVPPGVPNLDPSTLSGGTVGITLYETAFNPSTGYQYSSSSIGLNDTVSGPQTLTGVGGFQMQYDFNNGVWKRAQVAHSESFIGLTSAARTVTTGNPTNLSSGNRKGVVVQLGITNIGTGSVSFQFISIGSFNSGVLIGTRQVGPFTSNGVFTFLTYPGIIPFALGGAGQNQYGFNAPISGRWNYQVVANNANPVTYTVEYQLLS